MKLQSMRGFGITGGAAAAVFLSLLLMRMGVFQAIHAAPRPLSATAAVQAGARETWMNIYHKDHKIGFSHARFFPQSGGFGLEERVAMRVNTMGMVQEVELQTRAEMAADLSLQGFEFEMNSGRFRLRAQGAVGAAGLDIQSETAGNRRRWNIPLSGKVYLTSTIIDALSRQPLEAGQRYRFEIFDPSTLAPAAVTAEVIGREEIQVMGASRPTTRVSMGLRGITQTAWIGEDGELLRERGLLGMRLEKTTPQSALAGLGTAESPDLTEAAAVTPSRPIAPPAALQELRVKIGGLNPEGLQLAGGRQRWADGVLRVQRESLADLPPTVAPGNLSALERVYLKPEPLIQSDHERIRSLVDSILRDSSAAAPLAKARLLMDWIAQHIERRPVLSLPDALSTLEEGMGDCNEHAMLFAALARAAGIPARVEAGLVYLNGKFYYHAWNLLFLGRWVTADALFGQLPADVSHLRLVTGSVQQQLDLAGVIGNITIEILSTQ